MEIPATMLSNLLPIRQNSLKEDNAPESEHVEHVQPEINNANEDPATHHKHLPGGVQISAAEKQNKWFIGSIDCGTTSARFIVFNGSGMPVASHQVEFESIYPQSGLAMPFQVYGVCHANL